MRLAYLRDNKYFRTSQSISTQEANASDRNTQLVPRQRHLITSLCDQSIGLGSKRRRETLGDAIGRTSTFTPNRLPNDWLKVFVNATL